jgi:hypothetical protein
MSRFTVAFELSIIGHVNKIDEQAQDRKDKGKAKVEHMIQIYLHTHFSHQTAGQR